MSRCACSIGSLVHAQATGSVQGTVVAGNSIPVVGAKVKARHTATDTTFTVTTNDRGEYKLDLLPPGTYQVTAVAPNFGPALVTVNVTLGSTATANFDPSTPGPPNRPVATGLTAIHFEGSGRVGWTFADGVSATSPVTASDGNIYNRVDPADSMSWGFTLGVFLNRNFEVEFIFDRQRTTLEASGTKTVEVDSLDIGNYHGALAYNFGSGDSSVRPYFFGGCGRDVLLAPVVRGRGRQGSRNRRADSTLAHVRRRREGLQGTYRCARGSAHDTHLYQVGHHRMVVRPVLGLLRHVEVTVRLADPDDGWRHRAILTSRNNPAFKVSTTAPRAASGGAAHLTLRSAARQSIDAGLTNSVRTLTRM